MVVDFAATESADGFGRVGTSVKHQNPAVFGRGWGEEQIHGEGGPAVPFVASAPFLRPPVHLFHRVGEECLFGIEDSEVFGPVHFPEKSIVDVSRLPGFKPEDRAVADIRAFSQSLFAGIDPIPDDAVFAGFEIKKWTYVIEDGDIEVEEKCRSDEVTEAVPGEHEFDQHIGPSAFDAGIPGKGNDLNTGVDTLRIVGAAIKPEVPFQVAGDAGEQLVDIFSRVTGSIFQAEDIYVLRCHESVGFSLWSLWCWCRLTIGKYRSQMVGRWWSMSMS